MKKFVLSLLFIVAACDLQPKITALPDTVGEFISSRYPTLLADPTSQPEIYNSAATDYGVYASPEIYGAGDVDDYVLYSSVDDYIVPPQPVEEERDTESIKEDVQHQDTGVDDEQDVDILSNEYESDDVLSVPDKTQEAPKELDNQEPQSDDDIAWDENANTDDKLNVPAYTKENDNPDVITVARGDTLYVLAKKYDTSVDELAKLNNLNEPYKLLVGQKLRIRAATKPDVIEQKAKPVPESKPEKIVEKTKEPPKEKPKEPVKETVKEKPKESHKATTTRVEVDEITVAPGDTLYSLSRQYSIPVNDLAVMNNLSVPFSLYAGQKLKVPDLASAPVRPATKPTPKPLADNKDAKPVSQPKKETKPQPEKQQAKQPDNKKSVAKQPTQKQRVDAKKPEQKQQQPKPKQTTTATKKTTKATTNIAPKKTPTIAARSSSKFSWPVRGKILSNYGAKTNGLFNDGINIAGTIGAAVLAAENGVVAYAGNEVKGMGNLVIIQHSDGWMTVYAHMDSMNVRRGTRVSVGQKIGTVGKTGKVDKPQLHFEVRKGTRAYNPIQYLKK
ncbi:MAG: peptidoglycan DD-metalloendopeptidase family protein [Alphaproteobacteria bacterium]|nr:peptidoglycan DD-metalloendopeptidase family protein [Alphaproteobacteria bacterium]